MVIYFDLDGVLADFDQGVATLCERDPIPQDEITEEEEADLWESIRKVDHFYDKLQPIDKTIKIFKELQQNYNCEILSSIPKPHRNIKTAAWDKINWSHRLLGNDIMVNICYAADKKKFAKADNILIDDYKKNIDRWNAAGGIGILFKDAVQLQKALEELKLL